jgi:hypothetical protein
MSDRIDDSGGSRRNFLKGLAGAAAAGALLDGLTIAQSNGKAKPGDVSVTRTVRMMSFRLQKMH